MFPPKIKPDFLFLGKNEYLANKRILLLESSTKPKSSNMDSYSNRVCALNNVSKSLLSQVGAWDHIEKARFGLVRKMQVRLIPMSSISSFILIPITLF